MLSIFHSWPTVEQGPEPPDPPPRPDPTAPPMPEVPPPPTITSIAPQKATVNGD
jgi:hypothetical protein